MKTEKKHIEEKFEHLEKLFKSAKEDLHKEPMDATFASKLQLSLKEKFEAQEKETFWNKIENLLTQWARGPLIGAAAAAVIVVALAIKFGPGQKPDLRQNEDQLQKKETLQTEEISEKSTPAINEEPDLQVQNPSPVKKVTKPAKTPAAINPPPQKEADGLKADKEAVESYQDQDDIPSDWAFAEPPEQTDPNTSTPLEDNANTVTAPDGAAQEAEAVVAIPEANVYIYVDSIELRAKNIKEGTENLGGEISEELYYKNELTAQLTIKVDANKSAEIEALIRGNTTDGIIYGVKTLYESKEEAENDGGIMKISIKLSEV